MSILRPALLLDFARTRAIDPRGVFTRVGAATRRLPGGVWAEVPSGAPRFDHASASLGMTAEPQRVNGVRNARGAGSTAGVIGSGGGLPTNWGWLSVAGLTREVIGSGTEDGMTYADVRISGTNSSGSTGFPSLSFEGGTIITAATGETWTGSFFVKMIAGSLTGFSTFAAQMSEFSAAGTFLAGTGVAIAPTSAALGTQRFSATRTFDNGSTGRANVSLAMGVAAGASVDVTMRLGFPQVEMGAYATTPILAAAGAPAASTRAADQLIYTLADFGVPAGITTGTLVFSGRTAPGVDASAQVAVAVDDGTTSNRAIMTRETGSTIRGEVISGGASQATATSVATVADSTDFVVALAYAAGDLAMSLNGATPVTAAPAAIPSTLTRLLLSGWGGTIERVSFTPQRVGNAVLQSLSA